MKRGAELKDSYPKQPPQEILKFHRKCLLMDLHVDSLLVKRITRIDLTVQHRCFLPKSAYLFHADVPRFRLGNVSAVFLGLVPFPFGRNKNNINSQIDIAERVTRKIPNLCTMARSGEDILKAQKERKTAFLLGLEGATCIDGDPRLIKFYAKRGVRYLGLVHFNANFAASPKMGLGSKNNSGITPHGKLVIDECIRNGVMIDLAHISKKGFFDILDYIPQKLAVIVSHTMIKKVNSHPRGLDEDQIKAVASTDGVIGIMNAVGFLGGDTLKHYARHIIAARDMAGYKHVAIGSDLDGLVIPVKGLEDVSKYPNLTATLLDEGLSNHEISAIYGENMLRVLSKVPPKYPHNET
ncbi:MAG: hypothetical protein EAX96_18935 [Candidatus Lokiarchaeota archaeon]|nr:hypothetical protein [Candidatus Lokiarchaeota archaeon]